MGTHTEGLVTLKHIVKKALWQARRTQNDYTMFYELAHRGYRELRLHYVREGVKFAKLTPDSINCIYFPSDFIDFVALGVPVDGKFVTLTRKDDIIATTTLVGAIETLDSVSGEGTDLLDSDTYGFYARAGYNLDGYYKVDWDNRRIIVNSVTRTEVILAYVTSGTETASDTYVPVKYEPALIAYIVWQDSCYDDKRLAIANEFKVRYKEELLNIDEGPTADEWLDALYSTYSMLANR